jgi:uncharacterized flavoprotein (TIGR03862 family)
LCAVAAGIFGFAMSIELAVVGGGPAGLMAAEVAAARGVKVVLFERMGSAGRKFLIAGKGGLNLTHSEPKAAFIARYSSGQAQVADWLAHFDADSLRAWAAELGVATIIGSSGRVFPSDLKAAPLMRGWLRRLRAAGVEFRYGQHCVGVQRCASGFALHFADADADVQRIETKAVVFALGGGSWAKLGSDGAWLPMLRELGIATQPLVPSNCGFLANWSSMLQQFAGTPIKSVQASVQGSMPVRGELILSHDGLEGGLIYALSAALRAQLASGSAILTLDLCPDVPLETLLARMQQAKRGQTLTEKLKRSANLSPVKVALYYESARTAALDSAALPTLAQICAQLKALPLRLHSMRPIDEAISTAGGIQLAHLSKQLMSTAHPGLFFAGEMLDWDAPTGGYLLTACFASGKRAGSAASDWLR